MSLWHDEEGSIFVEMILFLPVIILIWTVMNFIYDAKHTAAVTQNTARECAWTYSISGCTNMPAQCRGGGAARMDDSQLRGATGGAFSTLESGVPGTSVNFSGRMGTHGRMFEVTREIPVDRPEILGGSTTATGRHGTMCADDPDRRWTLDEVWLAVCRQNGKSSWCTL